MSALEGAMAVARRRFELRRVLAEAADRCVALVSEEGGDAVVHVEPASGGAADRRRSWAAIPDSRGIVRPRLCEVDGPYVITLAPWIPGLSLRAMALRAGRASTPHALRMAGAVLGLIGAAGCAHLRLHPDNVILDRRGDVHVTDFGGLPFFTARGAPVEDDDFGIAALAWWLLTGTLPGCEVSRPGMRGAPAETLPPLHAQASDRALPSGVGDRLAAALRGEGLDRKALLALAASARSDDAIERTERCARCGWERLLARRPRAAATACPLDGEPPGEGRRRLSAAPLRATVPPVRHFRLELPVEGGTGPLEWEATEPPPPGVRVDRSGWVHGVLAAHARAGFTVRVTDGKDSACTSVQIQADGAAARSEPVRPRHRPAPPHIPQVAPSSPAAGRRQPAAAERDGGGAAARLGIAGAVDPPRHEAPDELIVLAERGAGLVRARDLRGAEFAARQLIEGWPERPEGFELLGGVLSRSGRYDEAVEVLIRGARTSGLTPPGVRTLAIAWHETGERARALTALRSAIPRLPAEAAEQAERLAGRWEAELGRT